MNDFYFALLVINLACINIGISEIAKELKNKHDDRK